MTSKIYILLAVPFILFSASTVSLAQSVDSALAFFPLAVGDQWEYLHQDDPSGYIVERWVTITGDTVMPNGLHYFIMRQSDIFTPSPPTIYVRHDSAQGAILAYAPATGTESRFLPAWHPISNTAQINEPIFGVVRPVRLASWHTSNWYQYAYGIGLYSYRYEILERDDEFGHYGTLVYAKVDGIEYGKRVGVARDRRPATMQLEQNAPNPFARATTIRYTTSGYSHATLQVIDHLGRDVATLVDEPQAAGEHVVGFSAEGLPSGIYLYRLTSNDGITTRRMVVAK
jgi:hypothetical protein